MNKQIVKYVLFPVHEMLRCRPTVAQFKELNHTQWQSSEQLHAVQFEKLQRLIRHAYDEVPYYRNVFEAHDMRPEDIRSFDDLTFLPLLTKEIIREQGASLVAPAWKKKLLFNWTSGSSGSPVSFLSSKQRESLGNTAKLRARQWWGLDVGDREIHLWGNARELGNVSKLRKVKDRALNLIVVSAYDLSVKDLQLLADLLNRFQPRSIYGYPSAIAAFSRYLLSAGRVTAAERVEYVISTAETLLEADREAIESAFGASVLQEYGAHDGCAVIAHDCPCGKMHTTDELVYLEFLRDGKPVNPGEVGEIVLTSLDSYGMPFIRYKIGDMGRQGRTGCDFGRGLGSLETLEGRASETLYTSQGDPVPALFLTNSLKRVPGIVDFQVEQRDYGQFILRLVTDGQHLAEKEAQVYKMFQERFGQPIHLHFDYVSHLPVEESGKKKWAICSLAKLA